MVGTRRLTASLCPPLIELISSSALRCQIRRPLPLWERASLAYSATRLGEGYLPKLRSERHTPHPTELAALSYMPSPTRGEGAFTSAALAMTAETALDLLRHDLRDLGRRRGVAAALRA